MEFLLATNNKHKLQEVRRLLKGSGHTVVGLKEAGVLSMPEETGKTFLENAHIKANAACKLSGIASLADDSGLSVDALDGAPGVMSARFSGDGADDEANNRKLLKLLARTPFAKRTAHFCCALVLQMPNGHCLEVEERCEGVIAFNESGEGGFGYDPLFLVNGKSLAQHTPDEKDALSHRGKAMQALVEQLPVFLKEEKAQTGSVNVGASNEKNENQDMEETV